MTRDEIDALQSKARVEPDPYISEYSGYLDLALKRYDSLKQAAKKDNAWRRVQECARRVAAGFETLEMRSRINSNR